jgi:signal transduction histidine kinase
MARIEQQTRLSAFNEPTRMDVVKANQSPAVRTGRVLVAVTGCVVVIFLTATIAAEHHASNITAHVDDIAGNAMPSVQLLSRARGAVMELVLAIDDIAGHREQTATELSEIRSDSEEIRASTGAYLQLPFFATERSLAEPLRAAVPAFAASIQELLGRLAAAPGAAPASIDSALRSARAKALELDDILERLVEFDAGQGQRLGLEILETRAGARTLLVVFDVFGVGLALLATLLAARALRRTVAALDQDRVQAERRASEFQQRTNELDQFSGRLAHDLLGPMSVAAVALESARRTHADDERLARMATRGLSALRRVRAITDALLRFARAGAQPDANARTDVHVLVTDLVDGLTSEAEAAAVRIELERIPSVAVACSPGALMSVLGNLIRNALKHMGQTEDRRVVVRACETQSGVLRFEVQDTGPGIPEGLRSRIFEPYFQAQGGQGIGLGLATVERLVQAHGGRVGVRGGQTGGSIFWFELPLAADAAAAAAPAVFGAGRSSPGQQPS